MKRRYSYLLSLFLVLVMLLIGSCASAEYVWNHPVVYSAETEAAVAEKVAQLADECRASGAEGDFEIAVWMHNWLIYNADYDETYTEYGADGVLLKGTGVCQSYTLAYGLLLDAMDIENQMVISEAMNHSWNLVKLEGEWYHVDCTWDDPMGGGSEYHGYFGLSDALMSRDHSWITSDYPACTSDDCNYYLRTGERCIVSNQEQLNAAIQEQLVKGNTEIHFYNLSSDGFQLQQGIEYWYENESWRYGYSSSSYSYSGYGATLTFSGYDPSKLSIEYVDDAGLETELTNALSSGAETIYIYDHSGNDFDRAALYSKASAIISAHAGEYSCVLNSGYSYSTSRKYIIITVLYINEDNLPESFELSGPLSNVELSLSLSNGSTINGTDSRAIWVIGQTTCSNTMSLLQSLHAGSAVLRKGNVSVIAALTDYSGSSSLENTYPNFIFGTPGSTYWNALEDFGIDTSAGFAIPVVFLQEADGTLFYASTGRVGEPLRLIATAIDGQMPIIYNNILSLPAALTSIDASAFEGSTAFEEVRFLGTKVTSIGVNAFKDCAALKRITIPDSVTSIADNAFAGCSDLVICSSKNSVAYEYALTHQIEWKVSD